ncbi:MAG TPA: hypothetical protein VGO50_14185 [Pyrinomonadaceae bacterium]|jgi:hypothetical protein|nr:hypothetical protein [Pyrinomonadaceae bacterium]
MNIARIVKSNSHVDYVARVIDSLDVETPPRAEDFGFGQFVTLPQADDTEVIGVIYDSELINPEYGGFGPRLSPKPDASRFTPDYLNEQGTLLGILLLGWRDKKTGTVHQTMPRRVIPVNQEVEALEDEAVLDFHRAQSGEVQLHYYSQIIDHAGVFALPLLEAVILQLTVHCNEAEQSRLNVLQQSLAWQRTMGGMRL